MHVLLLEWACAGAKGTRAILPEGFGMLRTLCSAIRAEGHSATAVVSRHIAPEAGCLGASDLVFIEGDPMTAADRLFEQYEAAFVVAPESHGILSKISRSAASKSRLVSCSPATIDAFSSKLNAFQLVSGTASNLRVPEFVEVEADPRQIASSSEKIGLPAVVKPADGAGSEATSIVRTTSDSRAACARLTASGWRRGIVQRFVQGRHLSSTFIANAPDILPLSINTQSIAISETLRYQGGSCPYPFPSQDEIWADLAKIVNSTGSKGLMGMDFVYDGQDSYFMEINPRMTTSCIGLSKVIEPPLGKLIMSRLPLQPRHRGYAQWAILPLRRTAQVAEALLPRLFEMEEVVSPPFSAGQFYMKDSGKVLVCVSALDPLEIPAKIEETRQKLAEMNLVC